VSPAAIPATRGWRRLWQRARLPIWLLAIYLALEQLWLVVGAERGLLQPAVGGEVALPLLGLVVVLLRLAAFTAAPALLVYGLVSWLIERWEATGASRSASRRGEALTSSACSCSAVVGSGATRPCPDQPIETVSESSGDRQHERRRALPSADESRRRTSP